DFHVTGVQTCALPIWFPVGGSFQLDCVEAERRHGRRFGDIEWWVAGRPSPTMRREPCDDPTYGELFGPSSAGLICESCGFRQGRSEERRVGEGGGVRW